MSRIHPDVSVCGKRTGPNPGLLCETCAGRCPICDSHSNLIDPVYICGDCSSGSAKDKCIICGRTGKHPALYCRECVLLGYNRDGCPRIVDAGLSRNDGFFVRKTDSHIYTDFSEREQK